MAINYLKIVGQPVLTIESGEKISRVKDFLIDPQNGKFLGIFCTQRGLILTIKFFIAARDIKNFGESAVMIVDRKVLENPYKNFKVAEILNSKIEIRGNKVLTESGQHLGEVRDYEVDLGVNKLSRLVVASGIFRDMFRGELLITHSQIVSIGRDAIIVRDTVIKEAQSMRAKVPKQGLSPAPMCIKKEEA